MIILCNLHQFTEFQIQKIRVSFLINYFVCFHCVHYKLIENIGVEKQHILMMIEHRRMTQIKQHQKYDQKSR